MITDKKNFSVSLISNITEDVLKFITSPEKKKFVIAERKLPFKIQLKTVNKNIENDVIGCSLYIDGKEIQYLKTFKRMGYFFGIRLGNCHYKEFIFERPEIAEEENYHNKDFGTVKINFFSTNQVLSKKSIKSLRRKQDIIPSKAENSKKLFQRSMTVNEGKHFKIRNTYRDYVDSWEGDNILESKVDFHNMIDQITFCYSDFVALQVMGVISLKNINHLQYIPYNNKDENYALAAIETIIMKNNKKLALNKISEQFKLHVGHDLKECYLKDEETVDNYIMRNSKHFRIDCNRNVMLAEMEKFEKSNDMIPWDFNQKNYTTTRTINSNISTIFVSLIDDEEEDIDINDRRDLDSMHKNINFNNSLDSDFSMEI